MEAGRKLDRIIAETLMDWNVGGFPLGRGRPNPTKYPYNTDVKDIPNYSTSMPAAWEIVSMMKQNQLDSSFQLWQDYEGLWHAQFNNKEAEHNADSAPHAICLAALKALK